MDTAPILILFSLSGRYPRVQRQYSVGAQQLELLYEEYHQSELNVFFHEIKSISCSLSNHPCIFPERQAWESEKAASERAREELEAKLLTVRLFAPLPMAMRSDRSMPPYRACSHLPLLFHPNAAWCLPSHLP